MPCCSSRMQGGQSWNPPKCPSGERAKCGTHTGTLRQARGGLGCNAVNVRLRDMSWAQKDTRMRGTDTRQRLRAGEGQGVGASRGQTLCSGDKVLGRGSGSGYPML